MSKESKKQSLLETHPDVAKQWHPTKNGDLLPEDVTFGSNKYIVWICEKGHEYPAKIGHRTAGSRCPYCYGKKISIERSIAYKRPDLVKEFHSTKNGFLDTYKVHVSSRLKIWWICSVDASHKDWLSTADNRNKGNGCPTCANKAGSIDKKKSFGYLYELLLEEWDYERNVNNPYEIAPFSNRKADWVCKNDKTHKWTASIAHRSGGTGCPICSGNIVLDSNSLAQMFPEIAAEWDYSKNGDLRPNELTPGSSRKIYWICHKDFTHIWKTTPWERTNGSGCPHCTNGWSIERIRLFISSLLPFLKSLNSAELFVLFQQSGAINTQGKGRSFIKNFISGKLPHNNLIEALIDSQKFTEFIEQQDNLLSDIDTNNDLSVLSEDKIKIDSSDFPIIETKDILKSIDSKILANADAETIDFLIKSAVAKIWHHAFHDEKEALYQLQQYQGESEFPREVKKCF